MTLENNKELKINNIDAVIKRYLSGQASDGETEILLAWLEESENNREYCASLAALQSVHRTLSSGSLESDSEKMLLRLNERINAVANITESPRKRAKKRWYYLTAAVCIAIGVLVGGYFFDEEQAVPQEECYTYCNTTGDVSAIVLKDSTKVWLHSGSIIECDVDADSEIRTVKLSGSAYFDVTRDEAHPFVVKTKGIAVRVLGTTFSVETSVDGAKTIVVLESGSVRLQTLQGVNIVRLQPNQKAMYDANTEDVIIEMEQAEAYVLEKYNKVSLVNATVDEIIRHVNEMYGETIRAVGKYDRNKNYTLNYKRTDSIETTMNIIETLTGIELINER